MLTVDEFLSFRAVSNARISPDGRRVAFEVGAALAGRWSEPQGSQLWLVGTEGGEPRQLTQGTGKNGSPAWSPDGRTLAFLSDRAGKGPRLYLLPLDGGEARALDTPPGRVKAFAWSPDSARLAFVRADTAGDDEWRPGAPPPPETADEQGAPIVVEENPKFDRVWLIDIPSGECRRATAVAAHVWELAWLPDGAALALVVADQPTASSWYACRLARLDLASGALTTIHTPPGGRQVARPSPSPDGRWVAFVSCGWSDPGMSGGDLWVAPAAGGAARNLTAGAPFSINAAAWLPDGETLLADTYDDNHAGIVAIAAAGAGEPRQLWRGPYSLTFAGLSVAGDGHTFAALRNAAREPAEVWLGRIDGAAVAWRQLTALHREGRDHLAASFEDVRWVADDGLALGGLLMCPAGVTGPAPLVTIVHGGPTAMASHAFPSRGMAGLAPLLAARGIAVFMPNYRGSNGRGVAFAEANRGDMGGADWRDILAGIDRLVALGVADPDRLGLCGWSYGGFMTMWAVTQTGRFKAAVAGAGIANWLSFHGASILHAWDRLFYGAEPYDPAGPYARYSPIYHIDAVTTPTLVLHGEADRDVPADQGREFFRALQDRGVETQLVLYPGSGHGPRDPRHIRDVLERSLDWLTSRLSLAT